VVADADPRDLQVRLRADSHADFRQWFYFRLQGAQGQPVRVRFVNAGAATYVAGWRDYQAVASYDRVDWFRVPTTFDGSELAIVHTPLRDSIYYAYFEPYPWERHLALLGRADASPRRQTTATAPDRSRRAESAAPGSRYARAAPCRRAAPCPSRASQSRSTRRSRTWR